MHISVHIFVFLYVESPESVSGLEILQFPVSETEILQATSPSKVIKPHLGYDPNAVDCDPSSPSVPLEMGANTSPFDSALLQRKIQRWTQNTVHENSGHEETSLEVVDTSPLDSALLRRKGRISIKKGTCLSFNSTATVHLNPASLQLQKKDNHGLTPASERSHLGGTAQTSLDTDDTEPSMSKSPCIPSPLSMGGALVCTHFPL
jgi:hypothetical protein